MSETEPMESEKEEIQELWREAEHAAQDDEQTTKCLKMLKEYYIGKKRESKTDNEESNELSKTEASETKLSSFWRAFLIESLAVAPILFLVIFGILTVVYGVEIKTSIIQPTFVPTPKLEYVSLESLWNNFTLKGTHTTKSVDEDFENIHVGDIHVGKYSNMACTKVVQLLSSGYSKIGAMMTIVCVGLTRLFSPPRIEAMKKAFNLKKVLILWFLVFGLLFMPLGVWLWIGFGILCCVNLVIYYVLRCQRLRDEKEKVRRRRAEEI